MSVGECHDFIDALVLNDRQRMIAERVLKEINARLRFLVDVGLDYLSLDRPAGTLSGGEAQRIRLATQIGSGLVGVLYVLDEPSIGLHQRDNHRLIETLVRLKSLGNTLIVVEHDEDTIRTADWVVDIGPGAGEHGGRIVHSGSLKDLLNNSESITGAYLSGRRMIPLPMLRRPQTAGPGARRPRRARAQPAQPHRAVPARSVHRGHRRCPVRASRRWSTTSCTRCWPTRSTAPGWCRAGTPGSAGLEHVDKVVGVDQSPIGRTPRSNPATYTGVFDHIRKLFAETTEAKVRGYGPGRFSFNVKGGRCENCAGDGTIKIEMNFLPDVYVPCEVCKGARYNRETLEVHYKGKTIAEVLEMPIEEAAEFFEPIPAIHRHLQTLVDVGLGYVRLGQPAPTLSGGEAQRVKLACELQKRSTGRTVYVLDEPTTGLHFEDIRKLLLVLEGLVDKGNTVIVIEHNLDVIKTADWIIDMGPEGGHKGGMIVATGTPEEVAETPESYTGELLRHVLGLKGTATAGPGVAGGQRAGGQGERQHRPRQGDTSTAGARPPTAPGPTAPSRPPPRPPPPRPPAPSPPPPRPPPPRRPARGPQDGADRGPLAHARDAVSATASSSRAAMRHQGRRHRAADGRSSTAPRLPTARRPAPRLPTARRRPRRPGRPRRPAPAPGRPTPPSAAPNPPLPLPGPWPPCRRSPVCRRSRTNSAIVRSPISESYSLINGVHESFGAGMVGRGGSCRAWGS